MIRRGIPLISGLLAIVACSMEIDPQVTSAGPPPPAQRPAPPPSRTLPPDSDPDGDIPCPADVPLTLADLDKEIDWKGATPRPGACSEADLLTLEANFKNTNIRTYFDLGTGLSEACFACIVTKDTDENWSLIVGTAENNGETGFVNMGACAGVMGGVACGKARQYEEFCNNVACNECTTTQAEREACIAVAQTGNGMCTEFAIDAVGACAGSKPVCGTPMQDARTLCGPPKDQDGGS